MQKLRTLTHPAPFWQHIFLHQATRFFTSVGGARHALMDVCMVKLWLIHRCPGDDFYSSHSSSSMEKYGLEMSDHQQAYQERSMTYDDTKIYSPNGSIAWREGLTKIGLPHRLVVVRCCRLYRRKQKFLRRNRTLLN
jgi:hypothetical protein